MDALKALVTSTVQAGDALCDAGLSARAAWLAQAFATLADPHSALGKRARQELSGSTGLSAAMVQWGLNQALRDLTEAALFEMVESMPTPAHALRVRAGRLCVVVLAGNVFTAAARAVIWPLLLGMPVLAKASSRDHVFPRLLEAALSESGTAFAGAYRVTAFDAEDERALAYVLEQADAVSVFGSDATLNSVRARLGANVSFQGHGHGLGAAFIGRAALSNEADARAVAERFAIDVAAYDQRGCMSPHALWVERGAVVSADTMGKLVHESLSALQTTLPRGTLPFETGAQQLSYRGVAALRGLLFEGREHAVCVEDAGTLRLTPGYRNVQVLGVAHEQELMHKLLPLGVHLKCLGLAGVEPAALAPKLPARVAPRLCSIGQMQSPRPHSLADGVPPWEGLVRYVELA